MKSSLRLRKKMVTATLMLMIALMSVTSATFAWYIYNTSAHTTEVHMAAGSTGDLQISLEKDSGYANSVALKSHGTFVPVSTNDPTKGFQQAVNFDSVIIDNSKGLSKLMANMFESANPNIEYYKTTLYVKGPASGKLYFYADFNEDTSDNKLSAAMRIGFYVTNSDGTTNTSVFELNTEANKDRSYNTSTGSSGYVLDASKTDGTTVSFTPYTPDNFAKYDKVNKIASLGDNSKDIGKVTTSPTQIDVYVWLEGCDEDCINILAETKVDDLCLYFFSL